MAKPTTIDNTVVKHIRALIKLVRYKEDQSDTSISLGRIGDINALTWACQRLHEQHPNEFRVALEMAGVPRCWR